MWFCVNEKSMENYNKPLPWLVNLCDFLLMKMLGKTTTNKLGISLASCMRLNSTWIWYSSEIICMGWIWKIVLGYISP